MAKYGILSLSCTHDTVSVGLWFSMRFHCVPTGGIKWGADLKKLGTCIAIASIMWVIPPPAGVALKAWHLLAIFLGTIAGIITQPLPLGAVAMLGLGASMMTNVLTFSAAFSAFASEIPWLIAIAF